MHFEFDIVDGQLRRIGLYRDVSIRDLEKLIAINWLDKKGSNQLI